MELDELRQLSEGDLRLKERETREEIFRFRLKLRTNQLSNPSGYQKARKQLARILTLIGKKSAEASQAKAAEQASDA